jgi:hypothetical protein
MVLVTDVASGGGAGPGTPKQSGIPGAGFATFVTE